MDKITARQRIDIENVFSNPGWRYFQDRFLPALLESLVDQSQETPADITTFLTREQIVGKINLTRNITDLFKTYIDNNTAEDETQ